jgi:uncharacterized protein YeaO (DUF488 family)
MIQCKSAYAAATPEDGQRILIERLWPKNCPMDQLPLDAWLPDAAPSSDLHQAFTTRALDFARFTAAYRLELTARP